MGRVIYTPGSAVKVKKGKVGKVVSMIKNKASGPIAAFSDGADGLPLVDLVAGIEPVQDLHGFDNPWPGGGGKNLIPYTISKLKERNKVGTWSGNAYTCNGITFNVVTDNGDNVTSIEVTGTLDSQASNAFLDIKGTNIDAGTYILSGCPAGGSGNESYRIRLGVGSGSTHKCSDTGNSATAAITEADSFDVKVYVEYHETVNLTFKPMLCLSSAADPTVFEPYSNVCPISGWDEVTVRRTGKNLLSNNLLPEDYSSRGVDFTVNPDKSVTVSGTLTNYSEVSKGYGNVYLPAGTYIIGGGISNNYRLRIGYADDPTQLIDHVGAAAKQYTFTEPTGLNIQLRVSLSAGASVSGTFYPMIRPAADADDTYEPYSGTSVTIDLPISDIAPDGKYYGGTVDVLTGVLTVDRVYKDTGFSRGATDSSGLLYSITNIMPDAKAFDTPTNDFMCTMLEQKGLDFARLSETPCICFYNRKIFVGGYIGAESDLDTLLANNAFACVYPLDEPITYSLTPQQLTTLLGDNSIWTDAGGDVYVEYYADTKLYVDNQIAAAVADLQALILEN